MKVTIRSIAKKAGVSVATVSRVINNSNLVREETKEKVLSVIRELGYTPNAIARGLSIQKTNTIGIIVPTTSNPFFGEIIEGAESRAKEEGYDVLISNSGYNSENVYKSVKNLRARKVDGILMSSSDVNKKTLDELCDDYFPFVLTGPVDYDRPVNYVSVDNEKGAKIAVEHLIKLGHKRIGYVSGPYNNYLNRLRYEGYRRALLENELELDNKLYFSYNVEENIQKILTMNKNERPTALFTFNDYIALSYMEKLERNGFNVPEDMALVGFDNIKMASFYSIELTTVENGQIQFGKLAVDILLENINSNAMKTQQIVTKPQLVIRRSCGYKE